MRVRAGVRVGVRVWVGVGVGVRVWVRTTSVCSYCSINSSGGGAFFLDLTDSFCVSVMSIMFVFGSDLVT